MDIGFLAGDEHRDAFASIFGKMLKDNGETLAGLELVESMRRGRFDRPSRSRYASWRWIGIDQRATCTTATTRAHPCWPTDLRDASFVG